MWEKDLHLYLKLHSETVFSFCLCKSTTWFLRKQKIDSKLVIPNNWCIKKITELLQTTPLTITWCIAPFNYRNFWTFCSYFLFFRYVKISRSNITWKENLPPFTLEAYMGIRSVIWAAKTKFLLFCWLSLYIIWIPISILKLLDFSRIIPNQITENINMHWHWYLYRNCLDTFPSDGRKWIHKKRRNRGSSIHLQDFHLFEDHY